LANLFANSPSLPQHWPIYSPIFPTFPNIGQLIGQPSPALANLFANPPNLPQHWPIYSPTFPTFPNIGQFIRQSSHTSPALANLFANSPSLGQFIHKSSPPSPAFANLFSNHPNHTHLGPFIHQSSLTLIFNHLTPVSPTVPIPQIPCHLSSHYHHVVIISLPKMFYVFHPAHLTCIQISIFMFLPETFQMILS